MKHYKQVLQLGYVPAFGRKNPIPRYFLKIAHKHYSHYYETSNFFDTFDRKALYRPFTKEQPNQEMADLFIQFTRTRNIQLEESWLDWQEEVEPYIFNQFKPDFKRIEENHLHDLKQRNSKGDF